MSAAPLRFSVVIPACNAERYIAEALRSVRAQSWPHHETIVVDDGSSDATAAIVAGFEEVTLIRQPNAGHALARNRGIEAASGDCIAFLDSDDLWAEEKLAVHAAAFTEDPELDYAYGHALNFLAEGISAPGWLKPELLETPHPDTTPGSVVCRRRFFERIGRFDPAYGISCDVELVSRARDAGLRHRELETLLLHRRVHDANLSHRIDTIHAELLKLVRCKLARAARAADP